MGLAIKSKRLAQSLYTYYSDKLLSVKAVRMGYSPKCAGERDLIYVYEMFSLLSTVVAMPGHTYNTDFFGHVIPLLKDDLKDLKLESKIHDSKIDDCFQFLSTIGQIIEDIGVMHDKGDLGNADEDVTAAEAMAVAKAIVD